MNTALRKRIRRWIPSIIAGGADNDPAGIATYSISGAMFGYNQLWLLILSTPMLIAVQAMCARLGDVKREGLMTIIKTHYAPIVAYASAGILIIANTTTLGADLAGVAEAVGLVTKTSYIWWVIPITVALWYLVVFSNFRRIERYLFLLSFVFLSYVIAGFLARPQWREILSAIITPHIDFSITYLMTGIGLLGTTITPFLFFWQAKQGMEEKISGRELTAVARREDGFLAPGFIYSNIISLFIMIASSRALFGKGGIAVFTAGDAARALEPVAGSWASALFAIGIIGSGLLAVPVLATSTAYVVAETFRWRDSLSDKPNKAKGFYTVLTAAMIVGVVIAVSGIAPMKALLYSQVLSGMLGPILITLILIMCNDTKIMGHYVNRLFDNIFGWVTVAVLTAGSAGILWQLFAS
ncbi:divalent metal cation transporter [Candidatus Gottesmanbacteria bacterium]|nr:divalent metal cation transporter [Candidatus Gottesmanbacteria bacterium]MBI3559799.1 divalent metal cation transporter [Candidatus Gottesmanbacteria bacterium]